MKLRSGQTLMIGGVVLLLALSGCGGSGGDPVVESSENQQVADAQDSDAGGIQDDAETQAGSQQCDVADFDFAELVFTESDRQWYCSVSNSQTVSSDEVFFGRRGTAVFSQYGQVYWNRNLTDDTLTVASPLIPTMTLKEINSANTTLQFTIGADGASEALYDCVLVQREDIT